MMERAAIGRHQASRNSGAGDLTWRVADSRTLGKYVGRPLAGINRSTDILDGSA